MVQKKKAIVTGGAGFIGSNLVDQLVEEGTEVLVLDDFSTGKREYLNPKAQFIAIDLAAASKYTTLKLIVKEAKPDTIYHLAALPRVEPSILDPVGSNHINVTATLNVFTVARDAGVKNIVHSSSSSVYGNPVTIPVHEDCKLEPMSPYALQKIICEQYAKLFCELYGMNITCLRYFNCYGQREPTVGSYVPVIGIWLRQWLAGDDLTITGDGTQSRDFVNVKDVVSANVLSAKHMHKGYQEYNVGCGKSYELNTVARWIAPEERITYIEKRHEPKYTLADICRLQIATKGEWRPMHSDLAKYIKEKLRG